MNRVVISGTGYLRHRTPSATRNWWPRTIPTSASSTLKNPSKRIAAGEILRLESSVDFIERPPASAQRSVMNKQGILDTQRMRQASSLAPTTSFPCKLKWPWMLRSKHYRVRKSPADIDMVICAASIMQRLPAMAIEVQNALGIAQGTDVRHERSLLIGYFRAGMAANAIALRHCARRTDRQSGNLLGAARVEKIATAISFLAT